MTPGPESAARAVGTAADPAEERRRVRLEAFGTTTDEAMNTLPTFYEGSSWDTTRTGTRYDFRYVATGDVSTMTLRTSQMHGHIIGDIPPGDDFVVQWLVSGRALVDVGRDAMPMDIGRPMLFPAHRPFVFDFTDYDQRLVQLDRTYVERIAAERFVFPAGGLVFDHRRGPSDMAVAQWRAAIVAASDAMRSGPVGAVLWEERSRVVAEAFLAMYPPDAAEAPPLLLAPRNAHIRAVVDHVQANAHLPLTLPELATVAGLSARGLQEAFRRVVGDTPLGYLRQVRLERVRAELAVLDPHTTSVADIARRWGFYHLGRFSGVFRQRFGEYPKDTLRS